MSRLQSARTTHLQKDVVPAAIKLLMSRAKNLTVINAPLLEICHIEMGQSPLGSECNSDGYGIGLIGGPADLGLQYPEPKKWTTKATKISQPGDIIVCVRATIGEPRWSDGEYCLGRGVAGLRPISDALDARFLFRVIQDCEDELKSKGTGTTFKTISKGHLESIKVPMIDIKHQKLIAEFIDWLDTTSPTSFSINDAPKLPVEYEKQRRIVRRIEALAERVREALSLRERAVEETEALFADFISNIPIEEKHWKTVDFALSKHKGAIHSGPFGSDLTHDEFVESGVAAIGTRDILVNKFSLNSGWYITLERFNRLKQYQIFPGDVLVTIIGGSIGRFCVVPLNVPLAFTTKHVIAMQFNPEITEPRFASYMLNFHLRCRETMFSQTAGSAQPSLNISKIKSIEFPAPPLDEQRRIVAHLDAVQARVDELRRLQAETQQELRALLPAILDRAFKGEL